MAWLRARILNWLAWLYPPCMFGLIFALVILFCAVSLTIGFVELSTLLLYRSFGLLNTYIGFNLLFHYANLFLLVLHRSRLFCHESACFIVPTEARKMPILA